MLGLLKLEEKLINFRSPKGGLQGLVMEKGGTGVFKVPPKSLRRESGGTLQGFIRKSPLVGCLERAFQVFIRPLKA